MRLSEKVRAALQTVVEQLKSGDLLPLVEVIRLPRSGIPPDMWSLCDRFSVMVQKGTLDC